MPASWAAGSSCCYPALLVSMDVSIMFVASPSVAQDLAPSSTEWLWMLDSYSFVVAALLVTMGSLADRIGRRRLLMIGAVAFGAASLALAMAPSPGLFITGRILLGSGAATLAPSKLAILRDIFEEPEARRRAVAAWTVAYTGGAVGPVLGGLLLSVFEWPAVFLINLPVMALLLITGPLLLPESKNPQESHFDFPGAALSLIALFSIVFAVKRVAEYGNELLAWGTLVGGVVVLIGFIARQRSAELAKRISPRIIIMTGFLIAAAGFAFIGATAVADSPWWFVGGYVATDLRGRGNGQCSGQYLDHLHRPSRAHRVGCQCLRDGCPARRSPGHCGVRATLHHLLPTGGDRNRLGRFHPRRFPG